MYEEDIQKRINDLQSKFRILKDWKIFFDLESEMKAQCNISSENKEAAIFDWGDIGVEPEDYILHEMLHICCKHIKQVQKDHGDELENGGYLKAMEAEEFFVQDLCSFYLDICSGSSDGRALD